MMWGKRGVRLIEPMTVVVSVVFAVAGVLVGVAPGAADAAPMRSSVQPMEAIQHSPVVRLAPDLGGAVVSHAKNRSASNSLDWAGFAVTGANVTSASGSWTEPSVVCSANKLQQSAFWVGIDGFAAIDPTVQQIGTDADCTKGTKKAPGGPLYYAWYEMYPAGLVVLDPTTYPVAPGNIMSASVVGAGASYTLSISNAGHWTYQVTKVASSVPLATSAEWVAEAPVYCSATKCKPIALADFGSVAFSGATVNGSHIASSGLTASQITMTKNKKGTTVKASTSALDSTGGGFTVTWLSK